MRAKKRNEIYIEEIRNGFSALRLPTPVRYTLSNMFIPFGMNDNYTLKLEFTPATLSKYTVIQEKEKELFNSSIEIISEHTPNTPIRFSSKLHQNKKYMPTIMCTVDHRQDRIVSKLQQKNKSEINTFYTLRRKNSKVLIECDTLWIKNNEVRCAWKVVSVCIL